ncbi:formylglycine-generating enzyme family protein [Chamaesiphon polymorphus]|nr:formylglycine-generating enzyme family protein [Chamaesiphon polymorphus]
MLQSFEFTTAKISDTGQISYFEKQGKYLDVELDANTVLTLVLASTETLASEDNTQPSFLIGKYPITQKQWYKVMKSFQYGGNLGFKKPVMASWVDAMEFCDRLSHKEGKEYRLPTEAEWEIACRAGSKTIFSFGNILTPDLASFGKDSSITGIRYKTTSEPIMNVGMFPPNDFGIHDMHGNIWEWCLETQPNPYPGLRPIRGGAYYSPAESCGCSSQGSFRYRHKFGVVAIVAKVSRAASKNRKAASGLF